MADKSMIRSLNRKGSRSNRKPPVATRLPAPLDKSACERCGATYVRGTWRATRKLALRPGESVPLPYAPPASRSNAGKAAAG